MLQYSECDEEFRMWDSRLDVEVKKAIKVRYGKVSELSLNINSFLMEEESSDLGKPSNLRKVTSFWLGFVFVFCFWSVLLEWNDNYLPQCCGARLKANSHRRVQFSRRKIRKKLSKNPPSRSPIKTVSKYDIEKAKRKR